jgi:hypothetical protein
MIIEKSKNIFNITFCGTILPQITGASRNSNLH